MFFSLICGTAGRTDELERLLQSLASQTHRQFELLLIDQNTDDRAERILARIPECNGLRLQSPPGLCSSLNLGIQHAKGEIIGFPDDDCRYEERDFLERLAGLFQTHPDWDGITARTVDDAGQPSIAAWDKEAGRVSNSNLGFRGCSTTVFYRSRVVEGVGKFDESVGADLSLVNPGSDVDYLHRVIRAGFHLRYQPQLVVRHPQTLAEGEVDENGLHKRYAYGYGEGSIARKYSLPLWYIGLILQGPAIAGIKHALTGDFHLARKEWLLFRGRMDGWLRLRPMARADASVRPTQVE